MNASSSYRNKNCLKVSKHCKEQTTCCYCIGANDKGQKDKEDIRLNEAQRATIPTNNPFDTHAHDQRMEKSAQSFMMYALSGLLFPNREST